MSTFKRTTRKNGNFRRTVTQSPKGTTVTESTSYGGGPGKDGPFRITRSLNTTTGNIRRTTTSHTGGGWTIVKSITPKFASTASTSKTRRRKSKSSGGLFFWLFALFLLFVFLG